MCDTIMQNNEGTLGGYGNGLAFHIFIIMFRKKKI